MPILISNRSGNWDNNQLGIIGVVSDGSIAALACAISKIQIGSSYALDKVIHITDEGVSRDTFDALLEGYDDRPFIFNGNYHSAAITTDGDLYIIVEVPLIV